MLWSQISICSYGDVQPDPSCAGVWHVAGCDQSKTFAFEFEFASASGLKPTPRGSGRRDTDLVTVQLAFAYTCVNNSSSPSRNPSDDARASSRRSKSKSRKKRASKKQHLNPKGAGGVIARSCRRIRVYTVRVPVATRTIELYNNLDPDTMVAFILRKWLCDGSNGNQAPRASWWRNDAVPFGLSSCPSPVHAAVCEHVRQSALEGGELLLQWFLHLIRRYNACMASYSSYRRRAGSARPQPDVTFKGLKSLRLLPRIMHAILWRHLRPPPADTYLTSSIDEEEEVEEVWFGSISDRTPSPQVPHDEQKHKLTGVPAPWADDYAAMCSRILSWPAGQLIVSLYPSATQWYNENDQVKKKSVGRLFFT